MTSPYGVLADFVALTHLALILWLVVGAPLAWLWPRLLPVHVVALVVTAAVNLAGMDCPLTVLEKQLDSLAGNAAYDGGFISHYLVEPVHAPSVGAEFPLALVVAWFVPTSVVYTAIRRRQLRSSPSS